MVSPAIYELAVFLGNALALYLFLFFKLVIRRTSQLVKISSSSKRMGLSGKSVSLVPFLRFAGLCSLLYESDETPASVALKSVCVCVCVIFYYSFMCIVPHPLPPIKTYAIPTTDYLYLLAGLPF